MKKIVVCVSLLLIPSWAFAETKQVKSAKAFDVTGKVLGGIVDFSPPIFILQVDGLSFPLTISKDALAGPADLRFDGAGCTGTAFLTPPDLFEFGGFQRNIAVDANNVVHRVDRTQEPQEENILSQFFIPCFNFGQPTAQFVVPTVTVIDLDDLFTPPFSIELNTGPPIR